MSCKHCEDGARTAPEYIEHLKTKLKTIQNDFQQRMAGMDRRIEEFEAHLKEAPAPSYKREEICVGGFVCPNCGHGTCSKHTITAIQSDGSEECRKAIRELNSGPIAFIGKGFWYLRLPSGQTVQLYDSEYQAIKPFLK